MERNNAVELESVPRKTVALFFIVDTSGSMSDVSNGISRIGAVDSAIEQTIEKLREMNSDNTAAEIKVAILTFSSGARWLTPNGPVNPDNYYHNALEANGLTYMGEAFRMLEEKLHRGSGFMDSVSSSFAPVLFLMTDGEPNDDYMAHLSYLKGNKWFKDGIKAALAVGNDANDSVLIEFTGSKESVVRIKDGKNAGESLKTMVQFIALKSAGFASRSTGFGDKSNQEALEDAISDAVNDDGEFDVGGSSDTDWP